tara:strand:- start:133 stop:315 length:183 start_codon:yes stop_codon:yes gene_type:complete
MSKWNWKKLDTYNTIQKVLLLSIIVNFIVNMSLPGRSVAVENMFAWLMPVCAFAMYLFKD